MTLTLEEVEALLKEHLYDPETGEFRFDKDAPFPHPRYLVMAIKLIRWLIHHLKDAKEIAATKFKDHEKRISALESA